MIVAKMLMNNLMSVEVGSGKESETVEMWAVASGSEANKIWSKHTPSGCLRLTINNPGAFGKLKPGYFKVTIEPCGEDD